MNITNQLIRRWFMLPIGIGIMMVIVGGVGLARSNQTNTPITNIITQQGRIDDHAAAIGPSVTQTNTAMPARSKSATPTPAATVVTVSMVPTVTPTTAWTPPAPAQPTPTTTPTQEATAKVVIQQVGSFAETLKQGDTALSLLLRTGADYHFQVRIKHYSFGDFVECLGDLCGDNHHYWAFYYNGQYSNVGASDQPVKVGDVTEWKWESF